MNRTPTTRWEILALASIVAALALTVLLAGASAAPSHVEVPSFLAPEGSLEERAFASNVTTTIDDELTSWRADLSGIAENAGGGIVHWMGSPSSGKRARGVMLQFFGVGADNATGTCRVWLVYHGGKGSSVDTNSLRRAFFGEADFTLSTLTGVDDSIIAETDVKFADTITWELSSDATTIKGPGSAIEAAFGSAGSAAYSPGGNADYAVLFIPDLGNAEGIILEMDKGTCTSVNATITRIFN